MRKSPTLDWQNKIDRGLTLCTKEPSSAWSFVAVLRLSEHFQRFLRNTVVLRICVRGSISDLLQLSKKGAPHVYSVCQDDPRKCRLRNFHARHSRPRCAPPR